MKKLFLIFIIVSVAVLLHGMNAFQLMKHIGYGGGSGTPVSTSFDVTIVTSSPSETFTLPLVSGYTYNANVDWGDTNNSTITAYNDADITHTYTSAGTYTIKITGTCEAWSFNNGGDRTKVTAVHFGSSVLFKYLFGGFHGCTNLVLVSGKIGDDGITSFQSCFHACSSLSHIPSGLFDNCTSVVYFSNCFYGCTSLTGSSGELWLNPSGAGNYTLTSPDYLPGTPDGSSCYQECTGLSDYATIPTYWK
jgi:hypothetical protein